MRSKSLATLLLLAAAAAPAFADDDLTFDDDAAAAPAGDSPDGDPDGDPADPSADELDAPTELVATAQPARFQMGLGGGIAVVPGDNGGTLFNAEALFALRRAKRDDRLVPMLIGGTFDDRSLVGAYVRLESVWHLGDRYSIGAGGMFGVVLLGATDNMEGETGVMVGPMFAPLIYRLGGQRQTELSVWAGFQRNLSNNYLAPAGSLSLDSYF